MSNRNTFFLAILVVVLVLGSMSLYRVTEIERAVHKVGAAEAGKAVPIPHAQDRHRREVPAGRVSDQHRWRGGDPPRQCDLGQPGQRGDSGQHVGEGGARGCRSAVPGAFHARGRA